VHHTAVLPDWVWVQGLVTRQQLGELASHGGQLRRLQLLSLVRAHAPQGRIVDGRLTVVFAVVVEVGRKAVAAAALADVVVVMVIEGAVVVAPVFALELVVLVVIPAAVVAVAVAVAAPVARRGPGQVQRRRLSRAAADRTRSCSGGTRRADTDRPGLLARFGWISTRLHSG